ncbi:MAG: VOC family protein [Planctomycetota bacterium]|nr:VOC family protein [Planctomycetota bacterium]
MLERIDRVQMAVPDAAAAAEGWAALLGAEPAAQDKVAGLGARRTSLRIGNGWVELLEPDGAGAVADAVASRGPHLFAAGASTHDLDALLAHIRRRGVDPLVEGGQAFLDAAATGGRGLRVVLSREQTLPAVGALDFFYEVTNLVADAPKATAECVELFGLDASAFVPIDSAHYGYDGTLTLFDPEQLHRFEMIAPREPKNTMGRFFSKQGESLYMAFAESRELGAIEERARELRAGHTSEPRREDREGVEPNTVFLHPSTRGGMMLGISGSTLAWRWSGHPERVVEPA